MNLSIAYNATALDCPFSLHDGALKIAYSIHIHHLHIHIYKLLRYEKENEDE